MPTTELTFPNLQKAWEGINEYFFCREEDIIENGGAVSGNTFVSYDNFVTIRGLFLDEELDLGSVLGYTKRKWTTLVRNYVDMNYLDLIRGEIALREKKNSKHWNYAFHFNNKYGGGKDCLISLNITKRYTSETPIVFFHVRTIEATKRMIFDFLLVKRICQYLFGDDAKVEVRLWAPSMFVTAQTLALYHNQNNLYNLSKKPGVQTGKFHEQTVKELTNFLEADLSSIKYKVYYRSAINLQKHVHEDVVHERTLIVNNLQLEEWEEYPEHVISPNDRKKYRREQKKKNG